MHRHSKIRGIKKQDFSTSTSETGENFSLLLRAVWCSEKWNFKQNLLELMKRWSKVYVKNVSHERALNFYPLKTFSKKNQPLKVWICLVYKISENNCCSRQELSYLPWQNKCSNLKTTCHITPKCFLWTKILENLLRKFFKSVAAALIVLHISSFLMSYYSGYKSVGESETIVS